MKKITSFLMVLFVALGAMAQDPNLAEDYTLVKSATFGTSGCTDVATGSDALSFKVSGVSVYLATAPEEIVGWIALQDVRGSDGRGWWNRSGNTLYAYGAGRSAAVYGESLTQGAIVAITCSTTASNVVTLTNSNGEPDGTFTYQLSEDGKTYYCTVTAEENGYVGFNGIKNVQGIKKIEVYQPNNPITIASYLVKYQDEEGNAIKGDVIASGLSGELVSVANSDKKNYIDGDVCYIYVGDDSEGKTIANDGSTVVTITYRKAATWSYTARAVDGDGNVLKDLGAGSYFETETVTVPYNQYIFKGGVLYEASAANKEFNKYVALSDDKMVINVAYNVSSKTNVVYFSEAEDVEGMSVATGGNANVRCSNAAGACNASDAPIELLTLTPGTYTISTQVWGGQGVDLTITCGDESLVVTTTGSIAPGSKEFTVAENAKVTIPKAGSNSSSSPKCLDWILIQSAEANNLLVVEEGKDLDVEGSYSSATYTRTIAEGAYGTICLPFAPDAASLENYTFFKMESAGADAINFVEETTPVANTPYIYCLKGENVAITGGATVVSADINSVEVGNWTMEGSFTKQTIATAGADTKYYGYVADQNKIVKANKTLTVLPYRAYFTAPVNAAAVALRITRGDETTEITAADLDVQPATVIYDLAGRRVEKMEKGIYIVNGKKVIR